MIVVTGGAGFIGSNLLAGLESSGQHEIVVCDRLGEDDKWRNIAKRELAGIVQESIVGLHGRNLRYHIWAGSDGAASACPLAVYRGVPYNGRSRGTG